jgi:hypothetical protein
MLKIYKYRKRFRLHINWKPCCLNNDNKFRWYKPDSFKFDELN